MASEDIDYEEALITVKGYKAKEGFSKQLLQQNSYFNAYHQEYGCRVGLLYYRCDEGIDVSKCIHFGGCGYIFLTEHAHALGPLSLFNGEFVLEEMDYK